jgi:hypothetical protein
MRPLIGFDGGYVNVARHAQSGKFQLWTQVHEWVEKPTGRSTRYAIAYAESDDGLSWDAPNLGLFQWKGSKQNNTPESTGASSGCFG